MIAEAKDLERRLLNGQLLWRSAFLRGDQAEMARLREAYRELHKQWMAAKS